MIGANKHKSQYIAIHLNRFDFLHGVFIAKGAISNKLFLVDVVLLPSLSGRVFTHRRDHSIVSKNAIKTQSFWFSSFFIFIIFFFFFINIKVILVAIPPSPVRCVAATIAANDWLCAPACERIRRVSVYVPRCVGSVQAIRFLFSFVSRLKLHTQGCGVYLRRVSLSFLLSRNRIVHALKNL